MSNRGLISTVGARNLAQQPRAEHDFYATHPDAVKSLLKQPIGFYNVIWEPAAGQGHIVDVLKMYDYKVWATDLYDYGRNDVTSGIDFLSYNDSPGPCDIITNPPFGLAEEFIIKALGLLQPGHKLAILLRLLFLESIKRNRLFKKYPPKTVYVPALRYRCGRNGDFDSTASSGAVSFAWFLWEKGYAGDTTVKFVDNRKAKDHIGNPILEA
jgi:hypothetical protein